MQQICKNRRRIDKRMINLIKFGHTSLCNTCVYIFNSRAIISQWFSLIVLFRFMLCYKEIQMCITFLLKATSRRSFGISYFTHICVTCPNTQYESSRTYSVFSMVTSRQIYQNYQFFCRIHISVGHLPNTFPSYLAHINPCTKYFF
jgi:hypothetical protein